MNEKASTAVVKYDAQAPIKSVSNLRSLLERQEDSLAALLPKHVTPERLLKTLFLAVNRQPELLECTQASLMESVNRAAELGLDEAAGAETTAEAKEKSGTDSVDADYEVVDD